MPWSKSLKKRTRLSEPLKNRTTFKIGGPARSFLRPPNIRSLQKLLKNHRRSREKVLILGTGSNLLVSDRGVDACVVKLDAADFTKIKKNRELVEVGAGKPVNQLLAYCAKHGLSGLEFLAGIPGTVGGALVGNAGVSVNGKNPAVGDLVELVQVMDYNGRLMILDRGRLKFGYRRSNLDKFVILSATFKLIPRNKSEVAGDIAGYILRRKAGLDYSSPNAGCVFKNPPGDSAGRLIDSCGLKGRRIGGAEVSLKHANFILNSGQANSGDVLALMRLIKKEVKKKYNISLKPEIKIWK
jgi:UDP-N-acetylmuramate dehydrogenase